MSTESINLDLLKSHLDTSMRIRHGIVNDISSLSQLESTVISGCGGRSVISPAVTLCSLVEAEWHANETNARSIWNILSEHGDGSIEVDSAELVEAGIARPEEDADYSGLSAVERNAIAAAAARDLEDAGESEEDAAAIGDLIGEGFDGELATILHKYGPEVAAEEVQRRLDESKPESFWDFGGLEELLERRRQRQLLAKIVTEHWGLEGDEGEVALALIAEGAHPAIAVDYIKIASGDLEVDVTGPIPEWQILALFNNDETMLEVSGAGQENFNGDWYISDGDAQFVLDNPEQFSNNAIALATYMQNHDDTLDVDYDPNPDDDFGFSDIPGAVWDAYDPTNGDSLWGQMGDLAVETGHEFTKVPGNLKDASVALIMSPVYTAEAIHGCAVDPNFDDCLEAGITIVSVIVAKRPFGRAASTVPGRGTVARSNFAQNNVVPGSKPFSREGIDQFSALAGRPINTVDDLTDALRAGDIKPSQIPIDYVVIDGNQLALNTRTSTALRNADIPQAEWYGNNVTGVTAYVDDGVAVTFDDLARQQLANNNLPPAGSPTLGVDDGG